MTLLPSALPKFRFGLYRHCSWSPSLLLAQFWFLCVPAPAHQAASHAVLGCCPCTTHKLQDLLPTDLSDTSSAHLPLASVLPKYTSRAHKAALSPEGRNTSPFVLWGAAHTVLSAAPASLVLLGHHLAFSDTAKYTLSAIRIC